jgi:hypothetical protein
MKVLPKDFFVDGDFENGYMEDVHNSKFFYGINFFLHLGSEIKNSYCLIIVP